MGTFLPCRTEGALEEDEEEEGDMTWTEEDTTNIMDLMGEALKEAQLAEETVENKSDCDDEEGDEDEDESDEEEEQTSTCSVVREINTVMQVIAEVTSCFISCSFSYIFPCPFPCLYFPFH